MILPAPRRPWLWLAVTLALSPSLTAAQTVHHLLGFVGKLCPQEPYCFELLVEPDFVALVGDRIKVRFNATTKSYDPENY